jgi:fermentation-respiration switch protein FrsA (DUF1100 family)
MKTNRNSSSSIFIFLASLLFSYSVYGNEKSIKKDKVQALKDSTQSMLKRTDIGLFKNHCQSFLNVIDAQPVLSSKDSSQLSDTYDTLYSSLGNNYLRIMNAYFNRQRPLTISWKSPTDGNVSLATVFLPKDWSPDKQYPLYVHLHGLSSAYETSIDFLTRFILRGTTSTSAYENGYWLSPWGRGNLWYQGISETDVWESKAELERLVKIDLNRQYLTGHSMGGYGSWYIASKSPGVWAALGVEAGALWYNNETLLQSSVVEQLKDLPTYFVVGTSDGLFTVDNKAYDLLTETGNKNTKFVTFNGAHEHLYTNDEAMYEWMQNYVNDDYHPATVSDAKNMIGMECFPNPIKNYTKLKFTLNNESYIRLAIYSSDGKLAATYCNKWMAAGLHQLEINMSNMLPGVYYCRLESNGNFIHKIMLVKLNMK